MSAVPATPSIALADWGLLLGLSVLWGGAFFFVGVAVHDLPPLTIVAARLALAATVLHAATQLAGVRVPWRRETIVAFAVMGFFNNAVPFSLLVWGQGTVASGLAAILNATTPLFTAVIAHLTTAEEKLVGGRAVGVVIGFAGVVAMIGPGALGGVVTDVLPSLACLGAALSYGVAANFGRRFRRLGVAPVATATGQLVFSASLMVPVALVVDRPWLLPPPPLHVVAAIVGLALFSTALAYIAFFRLLSRIGATGAALVTFLVPVSAIVLGTLVLGERLRPEHLVGMATIGIGLAAIDGRPLAWLRRAVAGRGA